MLECEESWKMYEGGSVRDRVTRKVEWERIVFSYLSVVIRSDNVK